MPKRPCLNCQRLTTNPSRCDTCQTTWQAKHDQQRGSSTQRGYGSTWRTTAARIKQAHLQAHGDWCPGWNIADHPCAAADLTVDHIVPKSRGGTSDPTNLQVLCRPCNSRKHNQ